MASTHEDTVCTDAHPTNSRRSSFESVSIASIDAPPPPPVPAVYHPYSPHVIALLIPFSILGCLARLGLTALTTYDGNSIFPLAYSQAVGCLIMGFAVALKGPIGNFYGPLYTGITTGFCGSLTTFSSWQIDVFNSWINAQSFHRSGFHDFIDGICKIVFTLSLSLYSVSFGHRLAYSFHSKGIETPPVYNRPPRSASLLLAIFCVVFYGAVFIAFFLLPVSFRHQATSAILFAFPGALTRYILSVHFNPLLKRFPVGTFSANMAGTALLSGFHVLQNNPSTPVNAVACSLLQGLADGYCGCLTTISTFATEVRTLGNWGGWIYAAVSTFCGQLVVLLILGPSLWANGVSKTIACEFE